MKQALFAIVFIAAPLASHAQSATPQHAPNLTNPQMRATEQMQPTEAHPASPGAGEANKVPTPVLNGQPMTNTAPQPRRVYGPLGH